MMAPLTETLEINVALSDGRERKVVRNVFYRKFTGEMVFVMHFATHTETEELLVIYHDVKQIDAVFAEPVERFLAKEMEDVYRFERIVDLKTEARTADVEEPVS